MQKEKSEQVIAVTGMRSVFPVRIFLADETCFFKVLDGSPGGLFGDAEILGDPFYAGPGFARDITAVIKINVDELRPMGKLVISIQLFEVGQLYHLLCRCPDRCVAAFHYFAYCNIAALRLVGRFFRWPVIRERLINCGKNRVFAGIVDRPGCFVRDGEHSLVKGNAPLGEKFQLGDERMGARFHYDKRTGLHGFQLVRTHQRALSHL